MTLLKDGKVA